MKCAVIRCKIYRHNKSTIKILFLHHEIHVLFMYILFKFLKLMILIYQKFKETFILVVSDHLSVCT